MIRTNNIAILVKGNKSEDGILQFVDEFFQTKTIVTSIYIYFAADELPKQSVDTSIADKLRLKLIEKQISFKIDHLPKNPLESLKKKAIAHDLFIISTSILDQNTSFEIPAIQSPVLWVPENYKSIDNILMLLRPQLESIKSIKNFCSLFQQSCSNKPVTLINLYQENEDETPENEVVEYLKKYCTNLGVYRCQQNLEKKILSALEVSENTLIIDCAGANSTTINSIVDSLGSFTPFFTT